MNADGVALVVRSETKHCRQMGNRRSPARKLGNARATNKRKRFMNGVSYLSLRSLMTPLVLTALGEDKRLNGRDIQTYIHIYHQPLMSVREIAIHLGCATETIRTSVGRLVDTGWAYMHIPPGRKRGSIVVPWMPVNIEEQLASALAERRASVLYFGEWLMRCLLDLFVKDLVYHDNAHPQWQTTPEGKRLQLDRWYYAANVAFEFQGRQHFEKDNEFVKTDADLSRRFDSDGEKIRLCSLHGVQLIELRADDLDFHRLQVTLAELAGKLQIVPVRERGPLFRMITGMCRQYTALVKR